MHGQHPVCTDLASRDSDHHWGAAEMLGGQKLQTAATAPLQSDCNIVAESSLAVSFQARQLTSTACWTLSSRSRKAAVLHESNLGLPCAAGRPRWLHQHSVASAPQAPPGRGRGCCGRLPGPGQAGDQVARHAGGSRAPPDAADPGSNPRAQGVELVLGPGLV